MPYNTANSINYGISNLKAYQSDLRELFKENKELEKLENQMKKITLETGLNPDRDLQKLWGNEFSTIQLSTFENLAIIKLKNGTQMQFFMLQFDRKTFNKVVSFCLKKNLYQLFDQN